MLRLKLNTALYGLFFGSLIFSVFFLLHEPSLDEENPDQLYELDRRLFAVEEALQRSKFSIKELQSEFTNLVESGKLATIHKNKNALTQLKSEAKYVGKIAEGDCLFSKAAPKKTDVTLRDVYRDLPFENKDGGVWKQGWDVQYDKVRSRWDRGNKLKVFVMPHSHNDPGWIKTFEKYFEDQTRPILNNLVRKLSEDGDRKFIWAEISYLFLFWNELPKSTKEDLKRLVDNGQLEIVTGGWVMNDEANTHYYAMIEQMAAGHEWMKNNLGTTPKSGWAIDAFGLSPTMAYLLQRMGLDQMLIQRVHYEIKKAFAWNRTLEFRWRQVWDHEQSTDMLTHMMPFYSYDVPHTCGPDPKVCCQFDFRRMRGSGMTCPWKVPPIPITPENVEQRALLLLDQYRKKSSLYKTNAVLIPLGDDFRYNTEDEWDNQFKNYKKLFEYMNAQDEWHVQAQFGTLSDFFDEVRRESARLSPVGVSDPSQFFPSFNGDFFTYADERDHYWSGYFTSRPFYKNMDRVLEHYLRSADMIFSMVWSHMESVGVVKQEWTNQMMELLTMGRRNLSLFQHHDGITGTSKDHVVNDYGDKLFSSITNLKTVISQASHFLLSDKQLEYEPKLQEIHFHVDEDSKRYNSAAFDRLITLGEPGDVLRVVFFCSHPRTCEEMVTLQVSRPDVKVVDQNNKPIKFQISPYFADKAEISNTAFYVSFLPSVPGVGLSTYYVIVLDDNEEQDAKFCSVAKVRLMGADVIPYSVNPFTDVRTVDTAEPFTLKNRYIAATFDSNGQLKSVKNLDDGTESKVRLGFVHYGVRQGSPSSGAYLFIPDGPSVELNLKDHVVRIVEGDLLSTVQIQFDGGLHEVKIVDSPGLDGIGLDITNHVDLTQKYNYELAMKFSSDIQNANVFFTDLNGFQMTRRERLKKLPLQANFYPMPAMAYIEDKNSRLTLISAQPLGVSSQNSGELEVMLDRRLGQDDNRGVGQGVMDSIKSTPSRFRLVIERRKKDCQEFDPERIDSYPSITAHLASQSLFYPLVKLISPTPVSKALAERSMRQFKKELKPSQSDLPCDIHLLHLRTTAAPPTVADNGYEVRPSDNVALTVHRVGFDGCFRAVGMKCSTNGGKFSVIDLFPEYFGNKVQQVSLTLLHSGDELQKTFVISLKPMELYTFLLKK